jgi:hypothetical protein
MNSCIGRSCLALKLPGSMYSLGFRACVDFRGLCIEPCGRCFCRDCQESKARRIVVDDVVVDAGEQLAVFALDFARFVLNQLGTYQGRGVNTLLSGYSCLIK